MNVRTVLFLLNTFVAEKKKVLVPEADTDKNSFFLYVTKNVNVCKII